MDSPAKFFGKRFLVFLVLVSFLITVLLPQVTQAAALTSLSDTMSRFKKSTLSDHTIGFTTPTGVDSSSDTITLTFPSGFTVGSVDYTDIDLSHGASTGYETEETLAATPSSGVWGAVFAGQVLTLTPPTNASSGEITASDKVVVEIGNNATGGNAQMTNHATAATYTISIAGNFGDSGKIAIVILDDDQVAITSVVDPSISFSLSANASDFGSLSVGSIKASTPNITLTIGTNSTSGYTILAKDQGNGANPGLYNAAASKTIGSADSSYGDVVTLSAGTEGYGLQASSAGATIGTRFDGAGDEAGGLEVSSSLPTLASHASSMSSNHTITVVHKAAIASWTTAGNYNDTITYIATANY